MRTQDWIVAVGASLCAGLFSACHSLREATPLDEISRRNLGRQETVLPDHSGPGIVPQARKTGDDSPYHGLPALPAVPDALSGNSQIHQAIYPAQPEKPAENTIIRIGPSPAAEKPAPGPDVVDLTPKPPPDPPLLAALRCFLEKHPDEALPLLGKYDRANQDMLLCLLPLVAQLAQKSINQTRPQEMTAFVEELHNLQIALQARAELLIEKMCFCEGIDLGDPTGGFGRYRPVPEGHAFRAPIQGQLGEMVEVYVELGNLSSVQQGDVFRTRWASAAKIYPEGGQTPIWGHDFGTRQIESRTQRHDFFTNYGFYVPHIAPGLYRLVILVKDVPTGRVAQRSLPFRVTTLSQ